MITGVIASSKKDGVGGHRHTLKTVFGHRLCDHTETLNAHRVASANEAFMELPSWGRKKPAPAGD